MEKYLQYKAADFAEDTEFIKWVQSDFTEFADTWDTFMNDNPSLGDEISEAIDIIELFQFEKPAVTSDQQDHLLKQIYEAVEADEKSEPVAEAVPPVVQPITLEVVTQQSTSSVREVATASIEEPKSLSRLLIPIAAVACLIAIALFFFLGR